MRTDKKSFKPAHVYLLIFLLVSYYTWKVLFEVPAQIENLDWNVVFKARFDNHLSFGFLFFEN